MYAERFGAIDSRVLRRQTRNARLRAQRLALLRELETVAAERAAPSDLLSGWLPPALAEQLHSGGALTLADVQRRIARGGRWWQGLPAFGPVKAARLAGLVEVLLAQLWKTATHAGTAAACGPQTLRRPTPARSPAPAPLAPSRSPAPASQSVQELSSTCFAPILRKSAAYPRE